MKKYIPVVIGTALTAFAISVFYTPNKIVNGGVSGIDTILFQHFFSYINYRRCRCTNKKVLMCAMKESETEEFQNKILDIDAGAFVIFSESQQILGNGFRIHK